MLFSDVCVVKLGVVVFGFSFVCVSSVWLVISVVMVFSNSFCFICVFIFYKVSFDVGFLGVCLMNICFVDLDCDSFVCGWFVKDF